MAGEWDPLSVVTREELVPGQLNSHPCAPGPNRKGGLGFWSDGYMPATLQRCTGAHLAESPTAVQGNRKPTFKQGKLEGCASARPEMR